MFLQPDIKTIRGPGHLLCYFHGANGSRREDTLASLQHVTNTRRNFVEDYLDSIEEYTFTAPLPSDPTPTRFSSNSAPFSSESSYSMSSTGSAGAAYLHALMMRGIDVDETELDQVESNHFCPKPTKILLLKR